MNSKPALPHVAFTVHADLPAIPAVRQRVVDVLHSSGVVVDVEDAALLTSEVVSNAVEHAATDTIQIRVFELESLVRVEVHDNDHRLPQRRSQAATAETLRGRGLPILDAYAANWGADAIDGNGKVVWFELPVHRASPGH